MQINKNLGDMITINKNLGDMIKELLGDMIKELSPNSAGGPGGIPTSL